MRNKDPLKNFKYPLDSSIVDNVKNWYNGLTQRTRSTQQTQFNQPQIQSTIGSLKKKNYDVFYVSTPEDAQELVLSLIPKGSKIGVGGSLTVQQLGLYKAFYSEDYTFYNQYKPGLTPDEAYEVRSKGLNADYFVTGTNAITIDGELINLDGLGNRIVGITYGPKKVIIVVGINKFVSSIDEGIKRVKNYAAVLNCKRLNIKTTPCLETGKCEDCSTPERICNHMLITLRQRAKGRVTIVIVGKELGF